MMLLSGYWPEGSYKSLSQQFERLFCYIYHGNILMVYAPALCFGKFMVAFLFSIHLEERDMARLLSQKWIRLCFGTELVKEVSVIKLDDCDIKISKLGMQTIYNVSPPG